MLVNAWWAAGQGHLGRLRVMPVSGKAGIHGALEVGRSSSTAHLCRLLACCPALSGRSAWATEAGSAHLPLRAAALS